MVTRLIATLALLAALVGCSAYPEKPPYVIPPDQGVGAPLTNAQVAAERSAPGPPVLVLAPNGRHVTGLPYPPTCTYQLGEDRRLPAHKCTPGSVRADITQDNIGQTICNPAWSTDLIRPPQTETDRLKTAVMAAYGVPAADRARVELDHDVPLELGGSDDVTNFWPEISDIPGARPAWRNTKDKVETRLHAAVCAHEVMLVDAQWAIAMNWLTAESMLGLHTR